MNKKQSAQLMRAVRKSLGLTQEKMAARLGVSFPTINRWENGRSQPSPLALQRIEQILEEMGKDGKALKKRFFPA